MSVHQYAAELAKLKDVPKYAAELAKLKDVPKYAAELAKLKDVPKNFFEMLPQEAVRLSMFPKDCPYNAIWDYAISPKGRHFFSLCAEGPFPGYVRFYEYLPENGSFKLCFSLEDVITTYPRNVRASKIHTSMSFLPDGRIIMATHTTAAAPTHPHWQLHEYYSHPWEGYSGSNILIYDPITNKVEDLGIPVQRDSIYGGCYEPKHNAYYFNTFLRGHTYRFDLETRNLTDYGQTTLKGMYYVHRGSDGNLYSTTHGGYFFRINSETQQLEDLGIQIPKSTHPNFMWSNNMPHAADGPDGRLYIVANANTKLFAYDYNTNTLDTVGTLIPQEYDETRWLYRYYGCAFDEYGVFWYLLTAMEAELAYSESTFSTTRLCCLDLRDPNARPVDMGGVGTVEHMVAASCAAFIADDKFYASDTNHGTDAPGIICIDLKILRENVNHPRVRSNDPLRFLRLVDGAALYDGDLYHDAENYYNMMEYLRDWNDSKAQNHCTFRTKRLLVTPIWREIGYGKRSSVHEVGFDEMGSIIAICNNGEAFTRLIINDGVILSREDEILWKPQNLEEIAQRFTHYMLPAQPGRRCIARATAQCKMADGRYLVGTQDGMLALVNKDSIYSLGSVIMGGSIHALTVNSTGTLAFGVAGDSSDLGMIFSYDEEHGLRLYGNILVTTKDAIANSCEFNCIAFAPDDKSIAVGAFDRMGCVYQFYLED